MSNFSQIRVAVDQCLAQMSGVWSLQELARNDPNYDWEFHAVETLAEEQGIVGLYTLDGILASVYFQAGMPCQETCLTIAHEIGHHFLHRNLGLAERQMSHAGFEFVAGRKILTDDRREFEAEMFGMLLLQRCGMLKND